MTQESHSSKAMTIEEARTVMWLSNNHRPLGQLLDEGFLNRSRLEWAAEKAYDPKLKEAASVLLASLNKDPAVQMHLKPKGAKPQANAMPPLELDITAEEARATLWPFRPYKGQPIGTLLDTKQLSISDLGYALEKAWDKRVKQAAALLLATRLDQAVKELPPPAGPLHVISGGRSYAVRRQYILTFVEGLIGGAGLLAALGTGVWSLVRQFTVRPPQSVFTFLATPAGIISAIILIGLAVTTGWALSKAIEWPLSKLDAERENFRKGEEGENRTVEIMRQVLDGNWVLFRNVELPGPNRTDLDAVLVGSAGVWVLEIKAFTGEFRNIGDKWEFRSGNRWKPANSNPSRQASNNSLRLSNFLKADKIQQWVNAVVVWANPEGRLTVENPQVAVWKLDHLQDELGNVWQAKTLLEPDRNRIIDKLTKLCAPHDKTASID